jgi:hypothetical protein
MTRGIVLLGVNNSRVDYIQLAVMAAAFIKKNMPGTDICLITDDGSRHYHDGKGKWKLGDYFTHLQYVPEEARELFDNKRPYRDTRYYHVDAHFRNETRSLVYDLSPFEETLLLDSDYLVCNDSLNAVWGSHEDVLMNRSATGLTHEKLTGPEEFLNPFGIPMYWATVMYFKKGPAAKMLFGLVNHIKENWDFYKLTYDFPGFLYRNDYAFSIAIHILNGLVEGDDWVSPLPETSILTALDTDQFYRISSPSDLSFFVNDRKDVWKFYVSRLKGLNVHCMNKLSLINNMDTIMGALK